MRTAIAVMIAIVFIGAVGCGAKEDRGDVKDQSAKAETAAEAPGMGLHEAVIRGDIDVVRKHIEAGSDLNVKDPTGGGSPLGVAATFGRTEAALALIEAGADVDFQGNDGGTPLHAAAFFCRTEIVEALLAKGADRTIKNKYGSTPLGTVTAPFEQVKPVYDHFGKTLEPLGLKLNYGRIEETRPKIAELLRSE